MKAALTQKNYTEKAVAVILTSDIAWEVAVANYLFQVYKWQQRNS